MHLRCRVPSAGVRDPESVAEHSLRVAQLASLIAAIEGAEPGRAALLAVWHDSQETRTGDIPHTDPPPSTCSMHSTLAARCGSTQQSRILEDMSEQPVSVSADDLHAASQQAAMWEDAVRRAERGEFVAVIAHGEHVADVVPSGELDRLRETIEVLSDSELVQELRAGLEDLQTGHVVSADQVAADLRARSTTA